MNSKSFLTGKIEQETLIYFKKLDKINRSRIDSIVNRWTDDTLNSEKARFSALNKQLGDCKGKPILDMSSGCGSFVLQGLVAGWDVYGIEPEQWKQDLIDLKFKENDYPAEWRERIKKGIGEELPYENEQFDGFNSWQTFEHVQNVDSCLTELHRVLKSDGKGIIHCPSYMTFYEGHYRLFWLPMLGNSTFGRMYVKMMGRPIDGLRTFVPIKKSTLVRKARKAGFTVESIPQKEIYSAGKRKYSFLNGGLGKIVLPVLYFGWKTLQGLKRFGRSEKSIHLLLTKTK
jgi:2-polyprenyl-3-methyl-5-hydroxy-6-metoxy-1,4-benzoquinol methylase